MAVIDTRDQGELRQLGVDLGSALGSIVGRLDPDSALRKVLFPAGRQERVQREVERRIPVGDEAQAVVETFQRDRASIQTDLKKLQDELVYLDQYFKVSPPQDRARIQGRMDELKGLTGELERMGVERETKVLEQFGVQMPVEQEAKNRADVANSEADVARGAGQEARLSQEFNDWLKVSGFGPMQQAMLQAKKGVLESQGVDFSRERLDGLTNTYRTASALEKKLIEVDPAYFAQLLLSREQMSQEESMIRLRASMEGAKDPMDILKADYAFKLQIRGRNDELTKQLNEIGDDDGRRDEISSIMEEMKENAQLLMRIDPQASARMVQEIRSLGRTVGVDFSVTDILQNAPDLVDFSAGQLNEMGGVTEANIIALREGTRNPRTGVVNERLVQGIIQRAEGMQNQVESDEQMRTAAATEAIITRSNPQTTLERRRMIQELQTEYNTMLFEGGGNGARLNEIARELRRLQEVQRYAFPTDQDAWFQELGITGTPQGRAPAASPTRVTQPPSSRARDSAEVARQVIEGARNVDPAGTAAEPRPRPR